MKLVPDNMPWKAVVASDIEGKGFSLNFEDVNDEKALSIFVQDGFIHNSNDETMVLEANLNENYKLSNACFTRKDSDDISQKFTVNSDGTISSDKDPQFVLGTDECQARVLWVHRSHKYIFLFENAQEILGLTETHG